MAEQIPNGVELTQQLIRFDTVNPPGRERSCAEFLANLLSGGGFDVSVSDLGPERANLVASLHAVEAGSPLVFTGHIDVVPLGTRAWKRNPFSGELADGRIHGRGASDMKSGIAAMVCAALAVARDRKRPNLTLVITGGEETGCEGAEVLMSAGCLGRASAMIVGEPTANAICVGHKGALWLKATATGVAAHGSMPEKGDNAIYKAARAIGSLETFSFDGHAHPVLGRPTLSVNTIHGGGNINSVPDQTEIGIDIRTTPSVDHAELRQRLQKLIGDDVQLDAFLDLPGVWTAPENDWVRRVAKITSDVTDAPFCVSAATFFSDASILKPALGSPSTLILGPGEPGQAHQTDEWCNVDRIREAYEIYLRIMRDWAKVGSRPA